MSKTVKFIVEMPKELSERVCQASSVSDMQGIDIVNVISLVKHGMPLDDVKAEIKTFTITEKSEYDTGFNDAVLKCFNALDNIGKAESEE